MKCLLSDTGRDVETEKLRSLIKDLSGVLLGEKPLLVGTVQVSFTQSYIKLLEKELRHRIRDGE